MFEGTLRFHGFSPKAGVTVSAIPDALELYALYSRPFKAPNVDDFSARVPDFAGNITLTPQQADSYELGAHSHLTVGRAILGSDAAWFYIDRKSTRLNSSH